MFSFQSGMNWGRQRQEKSEKIERKCFHDESQRKTQNQKAMEKFFVFLGLLKIKFLAIYFDCDFSFSPSTQKIHESWSRMCGWCNKECEKYDGKKFIVPSTASWSSLTLPNFWLTFFGFALIVCRFLDLDITCRGAEKSFERLLKSSPSSLL